MNILEEIISNKLKEVEISKARIPVLQLEKSVYFRREVTSLTSQLRNPGKSGIIAEIKRKSPSKGLINDQIDVGQLSVSYVDSGASALSVLTEQKYFGASNEDLLTARAYNLCPILRKDFIIDPYQIIEAKSIGADCILLIAACLTKKKCIDLARFAGTLGLEVLLEVHDKYEIDHYVNPFINAVGVNNRDLKSFKTQLENSIDLIQYLPDELIKISESGISSGEDIHQLKSAGYNGFLIGGHFMSQSNPGEACQKLIREYQNLVK